MELVYFEKYDNRHDAMSREVLIKQLDHQQKAALIAGWKQEES